jgi:hypothetical protein
MKRMSLLIVMMGALGSVAAQERGVTPTPAHQVPALVWAAYPDLRGAPLQWRAGAAPGEITVAVLTPEAGDLRLRARPGDPVLRVTLELDAAGQVVRWTARGPLTREAERAALAPVRAANRAAVAGALRTASALFGPDDAAALEAAVPLDVLGRILGPVTLGRVAFDDDDTPLQWSVALHGAAGVSYHLTVEPFAGRVTSLARHGGVQ